ncbi:flavin prenyltransferase UbiX [Tamilnaduibacter salinus]|nr:flavin prenyltransferase UbiX [Tamilnaduibacter salinus]PAV27301.1 aromatic acid decarboxylase [Tamilnaduibacter salinus]
MTGASGAQYGLRLLVCLVAAGYRLNVMVSKAAQVVIATETDLRLPGTPDGMQSALREYSGASADQVVVFGREDWFAPPASGSGSRAPLVICPCSTGTLSALANGASDNLIERAGDVALKERRSLILVPREAPYSEVHLTNMLQLTRMGATIMPASPGFYHRPSSIDDLVDFVVARLLDHLGVNQSLMPRWGEQRLANRQQQEDPS